MKILPALLAIALSLQIPAYADQPAIPASTPALLDEDRILEVQARYIFSFEGQAAGDKWLAKQIQAQPRPRLLAIQAKKRLDRADANRSEQSEADWDLIRQLSLDGDAYAQVTLARHYLVTASEVPAGLRPFRYMDAVRLLEPLRHSNYADAFTLYSSMHLYGTGVPQDMDLAWSHAQTALWQGEPGAAAVLADYWLGDSQAAARDRARSLQALYVAACENSFAAWQKIEKLTAAGDTDATRIQTLALLWRHALGADLQTPKVKAARQHAEQLAPADAEAAFILAFHGFCRGAGAKAAKATFAWAQKAADLGNDNGHALVANLQAEGHGTEKQPAAAIATLQTYAAKDNALALNFLGYHSYWGELHKHGMKKDPVAAVTYCSRAAAMGNMIGVINTAICYEEGIGVPKDYKRALYYRDWAARRGHIPSQRLIPGLYAGAR